MKFQLVINWAFGLGVKLLVQRGAGVSIKDGLYGATPESWAEHDTSRTWRSICGGVPIDHSLGIEH
jgi:hypothetical protein